MSNNILIIGAKGMLGSMLCEVFADLRPTCWDREEIDITDEDLVRAKLRELTPDVVINAAAYTNVDGAETDKGTAFLINETGVRNLAAVVMEIGSTLVHYSTDYVFPGTKADGYSEADSPGPAVNVYGESKLAGERALAQIRPKFYLIRTAWLYGPHGKNFVETMLGLAATHSQIAVVNDQHGSPTFTKDVAQFTRSLLEEQYPPGIYHAVNVGQATWFDFAKKIFEFSSETMDVKYTSSAEFPRPAKRPQFSILQNTRGPAMRPWQRALDDYIKNR